MVGSLAGASPKKASTLPLILLPEEVQLLREKALIRLVEVDWAKGKEERAARAEAYREQSYQGQIEEFKEERKEEIMRMADKIVDGKRKKLAAKRKAEEAEVDVDREAVIRQDIAFSRSILILCTLQARDCQDQTDHQGHGCCAGVQRRSLDHR